MRTIYEKYCNGDSLTDDEVNVGEQHFQKLADQMRALGPPFLLATRELQRVATGLESYRTARQHRVTR